MEQVESEVTRKGVEGDEVTPASAVMRGIQENVRSKVSKESSKKASVSDEGDEVEVESSSVAASASN